MALEPRNRTADVANPELASMTRRLWLGGGLTLPLLAVMVSDVLPGHPLQHLLPGAAVRVGGIALGNARRVFWAGWPFFERGWASDRSSQPEYVHAHCDWQRRCLSLQRGSRRRAWPLSGTFRDTSGTSALYFEAAAVITVLVLLGQVLELKARSQTGSAIQALSA